MSNITPDTRTAVRFAALDPYIQRNIPSPAAARTTGSDRYRWGTGDTYPDYLLDLYNRSTTLRACVDGSVDYILGDRVAFDGSDNTLVNERENARDVTRQIATNLKRVGGFAIQVVRDYTGAVRSLYSMDLRYVRTNEDNDVFWYSEKWGKAGPKPAVLPAFIPFTQEEWAALDEDQRNSHTSSVLWYKERAEAVYPMPCYLASIPACETEAAIDDFNLNGLENGFAASAVLNFNNGIPSDEDQDEIERHVNEKFAGHQNALRIMLSFNSDKAHAATVDQFEVKDFGDRFAAVTNTVSRKIATAFRANLNLFGVPTESNGFNSEEYQAAFKLFNRTQIQPAQQAIIDAFTKIYGRPVLTIDPFSLDGPEVNTLQ
ncbi:MAG: phage portal protein [Oscillibacter sp.]|nr:phage portal protein [Oscillibacter sp.]MBR1690612.1 phage portal protein [Oscillibacter sp.]